MRIECTIKKERFKHYNMERVLNILASSLQFIYELLHSDSLQHQYLHVHTFTYTHTHTSISVNFDRMWKSCCSPCRSISSGGYCRSPRANRSASQDLYMVYFVGQYSQAETQEKVVKELELSAAVGRVPVLNFSGYISL